MNTKLALGLLAVVGLVAGAAAATPDPDRAFVNTAAQGGDFEVAAGKLAANRGLAPAVKEFGQRMVTDHTAAGDQLKALADSKQWLLDTTLTPEQDAAIGKLESLSGSEFDKSYSQLMVKDHAQDIAQFEKELKKGQDPDIKAYAETTLKTLRHHLAMANRIDAQAKKTS
jgi:putative membrane protein